MALLAGLMVIPAVYVFSGEAGLESSGPGLMFVTLPKVFDQMAAGTVIGALFFILVFLAALTSSSHCGTLGILSDGQVPH